MGPNNNTNEINFANNAQLQTLNSIKSLQDLEKSLYANLEKSSANNESKESQKQIINKINDISQTRIALFGQLQSMYATEIDTLTNTDTGVSDQLKIINVVEQQLKDAKSNSNVFEKENINNIRQIEINTYYSKKYKAYFDILQTIVYACIPLIVIFLLARYNILSAISATILAIITIIPPSIIILYKMINISSRNNMDFDRFDLPFDINSVTTSGGGDGKGKHGGKDKGKHGGKDKGKHGGNNGGNDGGNNGGGGNLGLGCIGSECCGSGLEYNKTLEQCVIPSDDKSKKTQKESFICGQSTQIPGYVLNN